MKVLRRQSLLILIPALSMSLALTAGCSDSGIGSVSGTVTLDGKPLQNAQIEFVPAESGRPSSATTDDTGAYELLYTQDQKGAPIGEYKVKITTYQEADGKVLQPEKVPTKYNTETTLKESVTSGPNTIDFKLDSKGKLPH